MKTLNLFLAPSKCQIRPSLLQVTIEHDRFNADKNTNAFRNRIVVAAHRCPVYYGAYALLSDIRTYHIDPDSKTTSSKKHHRSDGNYSKMNAWKPSNMTRYRKIGKRSDKCNKKFYYMPHNREDKGKRLRIRRRPRMNYNHITDYFWYQQGETQPKYY